MCATHVLRWEWRIYSPNCWQSNAELASDEWSHLTQGRVAFQRWLCPVTDQYAAVKTCSPSPAKAKSERPAQLHCAPWGRLKLSLGCLMAHLLPLPNAAAFSSPQVFVPGALPHTHLAHPASQSLLFGTQPATVVRSSLIINPYKQNYNLEFISSNNKRHLWCFILCPTHTGSLNLLSNLERLAGIQRTMTLSVLLSCKHKMPSMNRYQKHPFVGNNCKI